MWIVENFIVGDMSENVEALRPASNIGNYWFTQEALEHVQLPTTRGDVKTTEFWKAKKVPVNHRLWEEPVMNAGNDIPRGRVTKITDMNLKLESNIFTIIPIRTPLNVLFNVENIEISPQLFFCRIFSERVLLSHLLGRFTSIFDGLFSQFDLLIEQHGGPSSLPAKATPFLSCAT